MQVFVSLFFREPLVVVASALIGLKPVAELYHRRHVGFVDAKTRMAEAEGFIVEAATESLPTLVLYSAGIVDAGAGDIDWFQSVVILSSLSTISLYAANICMVADADPRTGSYYPEYYNLMTPTKKWQAKLGLRVR